MLFEILAPKTSVKVIGGVGVITAKTLNDISSLKYVIYMENATFVTDSAVTRLAN